MIRELRVVFLEPDFKAVGDASHFLLIGEVMLAHRIDPELADIDLDGDIIDESEVFA